LTKWLNVKYGQILLKIQLLEEGGIVARMQGSVMGDTIPSKDRSDT